MGDRSWWLNAVGYEIYVRSFADADGDGLGDLAGIRSRLGHLSRLGVDFVWLTPFYPSPMADQGYDVEDYCEVDPRYGSLAAFDALLSAAHELGLRVVVDLVPNHCSARHPWFVASRSSREDAHRDWFHWHDPAPDGGPPNNWISHFGGPAWTLDETTGQYYLHLFLPEQPDLNWANAGVRAAFDDVVRFWARRGVDGFRVDVAHSLVKGDLSAPIVARRPVAADEDPRTAFRAYDHVADLDQPGVLDVYRHWRTVTEDRVLFLGEVYLDEPEKVARYVSAGDGLQQAFFFGLLHVGWDPPEIHRRLERCLAAHPAGFSWVLSSHDDDRAVSRYGGESAALGTARALALHTLLFALPGTPVLYMGEELGLANGIVPPDAAWDPVATRNEIGGSARDVVRTPMPWEPGPNFGFSTAPQPWLPLHGRCERDTVAVQEDDPDSPLSTYRRLIAARRSLPEAAPTVEWFDAEPTDLLGFRRGDVIAVAETGGRPTTATLPAGSWAVCFGTRRSRSAPARRSLRLDAHEAVLLARERQ